MAKIGLIHYNAPGRHMEDFLRYAADTGYSYVEIQINDVWGSNGEEPERRADRVAYQVGKFGLKVSALAAGNDFIVLDPDQMNAQVSRMRRVCQLATILDTKIIRTEGGQPKEAVPQSKWLDAMTDCLKRCRDFIEPDEFYLAVDNHGLVTNDADLQVELFQRVDSKFVGANLDTMNYRWMGHDLDAVKRYYEKIAPYTFHVHMKDGRGSRDAYRGLALGEGQIDLRYAVKCLNDVGYDGVWCAEYEGDDPVAGYQACFAWLRANL